MMIRFSAQTIMPSRRLRFGDNGQPTETKEEEEEELNEFQKSLTAAIKKDGDVMVIKPTPPAKPLTEEELRQVPGSTGWL